MYKKILIIILSIIFVQPLYAQEARPMKKALMVIAAQDFRDEEFFGPKEILERSNIKVTVASSSLDTSRGVLGGTYKPDILLDKVNLADFDLLVFVGGAGAQEYWDNPAAHKLGQQALAQNKVIGAICIAPVILARAGILKGRRATVFSSESQELKSYGAIYTAADVEKDNNIITASGPGAAKAFGQTLVETLK